MAHNRTRAALYACVVALVTLAGAPSRADDSAQTSERLRQLELQNQQLQDQLRRQQELIDSLSRKVNEIQETNTQRGKELEDLHTEMKEAAPAAKNSGAFSLNKVSISGEGGVAFFAGGSQSAYPNPEFRVDEAKLFVDSTADNHRDIYYYCVEGVHDLVRKLYAGARFSQIFAPNGFPIAANGDPSQFLFSGTLTDEIWRLSLCLGYRWSENLILKTEYTFERGKEVGGGTRNHEDLFAIQAAFKF